MSQTNVIEIVRSPWDNLYIIIDLYTLLCAPCEHDDDDETLPQQNLYTANIIATTTALYTNIPSTDTY